MIEEGAQILLVQESLDAEEIKRLWSRSLDSLPVNSQSTKPEIRSIK
jgi:hypothetical protein